MERKFNKVPLFLFGESGFGKSSFINFALNRNLVKTSIASSETSKVQDYVMNDGFLKGFRLIDTPGLNDTRGITDSHIFNLIQDKVEHYFFKEKIEQLKFITFLSFAESRAKLMPRLAQLVSRFGDAVLSSLIVLITKADCADDEEMESIMMEIDNQLKSMKRHASQEFLSKITIVKWSNLEPLPDQETTLLNALSKCNNFSPKFLQEIRDRIQREYEQRIAKLKTKRDVIKTANEEVEEQVYYDVPEKQDYKELQKKESEIDVIDKTYKTTGWLFPKTQVIENKRKEKVIHYEQVTKQRNQLVQKSKIIKTNRKKNVVDSENIPEKELKSQKDDIYKNVVKGIRKQAMNKFRNHLY